MNVNVANKAQLFGPAPRKKQVFEWSQPHKALTVLKPIWVRDVTTVLSVGRFENNIFFPLSEKRRILGIAQLLAFCLQDALSFSSQDRRSSIRKLVGGDYKRTLLHQLNWLEQVWIRLFVTLEPIVGVSVSFFHQQLPMV